MQYVAPQLWAWREWRMKKLRRWIDRLACILPFEEDYFRAHGVNATFVGHPLFDELPPHGASPPRRGEIPRSAAGRRALPGRAGRKPSANFPVLLDGAAKIVREAFPKARS